VLVCYERKVLLTGCGWLEKYCWLVADETSEHVVKPCPCVAIAVLILELAVEKVSINQIQSSFIIFTLPLVARYRAAITGQRDHSRVSCACGRPPAPMQGSVLSVRALKPRTRLLLHRGQN
jgi:hypothetical protein